jgi:predicted dehydrogenase
MGSSGVHTVRWGLICKCANSLHRLRVLTNYVTATGGIATTFAKDLLIDPKTRGVEDVVHNVTAVASSSAIASARRFHKTVIQPRQDPDVVCNAYGSYEELLRDPAVDIVYIATPHSHHYQNCMLALENGKAVLCEKPIAVNAVQAQKLYDVAREKGLFLMEAVWTRFFPLSIAVRNLIRDGSIGDLVRVFVNNSTGTEVETLERSHRYLNKSLAGGALLDIGCYALTWLFQTLFHTQDAASRRPPTALTSLVEFHEPSGTDQMTSLIMRFDMASNSMRKTAHGIATTSMILPDSTADGGPTIHIYGLKGEIQVRGPAHRPRSIKVIPKHGEAYSQAFEIPSGGHGMFWEADAAARSWLDQEMECKVMPWAESVLLMDAMDQIRRQANIIYPEEIETTEYPVALESRK